jgi:anti-sigma regulatory factor (Ser/Thr protein kinase)
MSIRLRDHLNLAAVATAPGCSRMFARATLTRWGAVDVVDDAMLVVSELVTNAVNATGVSGPLNWAELPPLSLLTVRLVALDGSVVIEVWDSSPKEPVARTPAPDDEHGRGLHLVGHLARRWGFYPHRGGKVVWAELPLRPPGPGGLPKRRGPASSSSPSAGAAGRRSLDPQIFRRLIDGLREL